MLLHNVFKPRHQLHPLSSVLRTNVAWTLVGNVVFAGCQWAVLSTLAKLTTVEVVGKYALALAVVAPLMMIANFNIGVILVTDTNQQCRFVDYRAARLALIGVTFVLILAVTSLFHSSRELTLLILLVGMVQAVDCYSELHFAMMQRHERMSRIAVSFMLRGSLSLGAAAIVVYYTRSLLWAVAAMVACRLLVLVMHDLWMGSDSISADHEGDAKELQDNGPAAGGQLQQVLRITRTALPLTIVTFLTVLSANIPRYFIERYSGHHDLGIFAAMWSLVTAGNMIAIAIGQAAFPRLSKMYAAQDLRGFRRLVGRSVQAGVALGIVGTCISLVAGKQILQLLYRSEYAERHWLFTAVMLTGTLPYIITGLGYAATSARSFKSQAALMSVVVATMFVASAILVPRFGLGGAVLAVALGFMSHIVGLSLIVRGLLHGPVEITARPSFSVEGA